MLSCEISQIFKDNFFTEHLWWLLLEGVCERTNSGAHLAGGVQGFRAPALFCALKFFSKFRRNALKNQFKNQKNRSKQCKMGILVRVFNAT